MLPGTEATGQTQSLYRKYRPTTFEADSLVGQSHVTRTLQNAIAQGRVAHAYLFCGPRGTGKTSTARLLAKAVNCLDPDPDSRPCNDCESCNAINQNRATDVIEIDAASNRGIEDMRDLRERVKYAPTQLRTKFYIIDEAHRLTRDAFNAFLKTLEEPPPNTIFVLATTEPDELLETVASRCQRFDFRRIPAEDMHRHLLNVARAEGIEIDEEAVGIIVRQATGSARDAVGLLDMLAVSAGRDSASRIDVALVRQMLGLSQDQRTLELIDAIAARDIAAGLTIINDAVETGQEMRAFGRQIISALRLLMLIRAGANPPEADEPLRALAARFELPDLLQVNRQFSEVDFAIRNGGFPQLPIELAFVGSIVQQPGTYATAAAPVERQVERQPEPSRPVERFERPAPVPPRQPEPRQATPPRPVETPAASPPSTPPARQPARPAPAAGGSGTLNDVVANWDGIRTEVKTIDRKIDALLASTDPGDVRGTTLYLVAAYPFHRGKINENKVREVIEDAVERVINQRLTVTAVLSDELRAAAPPPDSGGPPPEDDGGDEPGGSGESDNGVDTDITAAVESGEESLVARARAIFEAEEVSPDSLPGLR